ncbi:MAG TPA: ferrochelatase, partial [Neisseriales bacterium]|nr:ferrochelatase [Neisseriales bacterium]
VLCFQSKFGKAKWVEPATEVVIKDLAIKGINTLDVICPGFVSDCLETLEEVAIQYRDLFIQSGGTKLNYIPCLNDSLDLIKVLAELSN